MHDTYEFKAKEVGWKTQESCKVEYEDLPDTNKQVMIYTAKKVLEQLEKDKVDMLLELVLEIDYVNVKQ